MRYFKAVVFALLPVVMLSISGCGGSSGGSATNPFEPKAEVVVDPGTTPTTPVTTQDPDFTLSVTTDLKTPTDLTSLPQVDVNMGTVLLTARVLNVSGGVFVDPDGLKTGNGSPLPNQKITFKIIAGPGTISYVTPVTDKNGEIKAVLTTGNVAFTTNVIVEADTTVGDKNYRAYTSFQIVRGTGVIMFTSAAGLQPGGQTNVLPPMDTQVVVPASPPYPTWIYHQLLPFKLTDSNGNPRVGVPVTISVYSLTPDWLSKEEVTIDFLVPPVTEPTQQTITTDSAGQGIFNATIGMIAPPIDETHTVSVVYKAVTNDVIPVTAYVGGIYSITGKKATQ
jgi:hypothetical protein